MQPALDPWAAQAAATDPQFAHLLGMQMRPGQDIGGLHVTFYVHAVLNPRKTAEAGRPIYDEKDYIRIHTAGDSTTRVEHEVTNDEKEKFSDQYSRWKAGRAAGASGTPCSILASTSPPVLNLAQVRELAEKPFYVTTVEQLAAMSDAACILLQGWGPQARGGALRFLELAKEKEPQVKLQRELQARDEQIAALKAQMAALEEKLTAPPTTSAPAVNAAPAQNVQPPAARPR